MVREGTNRETAAVSVKPGCLPLPLHGTGSRVLLSRTVSRGCWGTTKRKTLVKSSLLFLGAKQGRVQGLALQLRAGPTLPGPE